LLASYAVTLKTNPRVIAVSSRSAGVVFVDDLKMMQDIDLVKPRLDLSSYPKQIQDLWGKLPKGCKAFERKLTEREERKGIAATWMWPKIHPKWPEVRGIGLNAKQWVRYVTIDCDHGDIDLWKAIGLPPLMIVFNPWDHPDPEKRGRHHVTYELSGPVSFGPKSVRKYQVRLSLIQRALIRALDGDPHYTMQTTKNPLHKDFLVIFPDGGRPYSFEEFAAALGVEIEAVIEDEAKAYEARRHGRRKGLALASQDPGSRNASLFEEVRWWAYDLCWDRWNEWHGGGHLPWVEFRSEVLERLEERNVGGLLHCELEAMASSVTKFCRLNLRPRAQSDGKQRGVMHLDDTLPLAERQAQGGKYGPAKAKTKNRAAIADAFWRLTMANAGITPTQIAVAEAAGVSLETVKRAWKELRHDHEGGNPSYAESLVSNGVLSDSPAGAGVGTRGEVGAESRVTMEVEMEEDRKEVEKIMEQVRQKSPAFLGTRPQPSRFTLPPGQEPPPDEPGWVYVTNRQQWIQVPHFLRRTPGAGRDASALRRGTGGPQAQKGKRKGWATACQDG